jgi:peptide/nickel transport system ATP-binding protein
MATHPRDPLLVVDDLSCEFDVSPPWLNRVLESRPKQIIRAVSGVSFAIERGSTFSLVGESGCGKSTVARLIAGIYRPTGGSIRFHEPKGKTSQPEGSIRPRHRLQMIFQDPYASLDPRWRVERIVAEPIRTLGLMSDGRAIRRRVHELLSLVGLGPSDGDRYPHEFSGGQRQRISIARALSGNPEFLICDEPTSALDVSVQAQILNLMSDLQDALGLTYLFISHNLAVVKHISTRVGVMYLGRLVEVAETETLFARPRHPYTRMLLEAIPDMNVVGKARTPVSGEVPNPINPPPGCAFHPRCPLANERCRRERPVLALDAGLGEVACHAVQEGRS